MNTFGLMEIIVLSIGYVVDVPSPKVSTMLVSLVVVITFLTSPALSAIQYLRRKQELAIVNPVPEKM